MRALRVQLGVALAGKMLPEGSKVLVKPGPMEILNSWRQLGFKRQNIVVIDPKDKPDADLLPSEHVTLLFTDKPNKQWDAWMKKHGVKLVEKGDLNKVQMKGLLIQGHSMLGGFKLTSEAAEFVSDWFGDDSANRFFSACFTIDMARPPEKTLLGLDELLDIWPDTGAKDARMITHSLGTMRALEVFLKVPRKTDALFGLWRYTEMVCLSKKPEFLNLVHAYRSMCDRKRFPYWEGYFLLLHACYKEATWQSKSSKRVANPSLSSVKRSTPLQDLSRRSGIDLGVDHG